MKCVLAYLGDCDGRITRHHCVPQQRIRKKFPVGAQLNPVTGPKYLPIDRRDGGKRRDVTLRQILDDARNLLPMCFHHHLGWEKRSAGVRLTRDHIPASVERFARDYGMRWSLDRDYGQRTKALVA